MSLTLGPVIKKVAACGALRKSAVARGGIARFSSTVHDDPKIIEEEKNRNLSGVQGETSTPHEHAPGWNEYLATSSEANVKADKGSNGVDVMVKKTIEHVHKRHHAQDGSHHVEMNIEREEVQGPLRSAGPGVAQGKK